MADFKQAIGFILEHEGGYVNDKDDSGGETYRGISRKDNPGWDDWALVDMHKPLKWNQIIRDAVLEEAIETYYYKKYWCGILGDQINDQKFAGFLFDWFVNSGGVAVKKLQEVLGLTEDGHLGEKTLAAINADPNIYIKFRLRRIKFYNDHVQAVPKDGKYLAGWLKRVNDYQ